MIAIYLTPEQQAALMRPINMPRDRFGGFQTLIDRLQSNCRHDGRGYRLTLSHEDAERVVHYANDFGNGTYQGQLRTFADQVAAELGQAAAAQPDLFGGAE